MMTKKLNVLIVMSLAGLSVFAAQERVIQIQNNVRAGFDDNVLLTETNETDTGFITEIFTINGEFNFSERTDALVFWQPEFRNRFDADPELITQQDIYGSLRHAVSQRAFLELSDRLRYLERDGQQTVTGGPTDDRNYVENNIQGALSYTVSDQGAVRVGGSHTMRQWDEESYARFNDFTRYEVDGYYQHELKPDTTKGLAGVQFSDHEYENNRGYDAITVYGGIDQTFSPALLGVGRVGVSMNNIDDGSDSTTPYLQGSFQYSATERTAVNGSVSYSISQAENTAYSAQDRLSIALGLGHDLTGKIRVSSSVSHVFSQFKSDYASTVLPDVDESYTTLSFRASYQINRQNFVEAGFEFSERTGDLQEYERTIADIGWRLRL